MDTKEIDMKHQERFNDALSKLSQVSLAYQSGKLKHFDFANQMDALIDASGWTKQAFQEEVERRQQKLGNK